MKKDKFIISKKSFSSRLIVGTGKYKSMQECAKAINLSGAEIVTVAVRRVNITDKKKPFQMALAFKNAVIAGRQSYLSGRIKKTLYGNSSSPKSGII